MGYWLMILRQELWSTRMELIQQWEQPIANSQ